MSVFILNTSVYRISQLLCLYSRGDHNAACTRRVCGSCWLISFRHWAVLLHYATADECTCILTWFLRCGSGNLSSWPELVYVVDDSLMNGYGTMGERYWQGKAKGLRENHALVPLFSTIFRIERLLWFSQQISFVALKFTKRPDFKLKKEWVFTAAF